MEYHIMSLFYCFLVKKVNYTYKVGKNHRPVWSYFGQAVW
jgi:hypothetical protein